MYEWNEAIQKMLDWIEDHIQENPTLQEMSAQIGYSPWYCSTQFHQLTGMTLRRYTAGRRLYRATLALRDTRDRILDIALDYGFSSQEAFTRSFVAAFSCTPLAYRKNPRPLKLPMKRNVFFPDYYDKKGEPTMNETILTTPHVRVEYIPAHKYLGIWDEEVNAYFPFWDRHNCDEVCGVIDSMSHVSDPVVTCHTAGWFLTKGKRGYFYGLGVPADYDGPIPEGFELKEFPGSYYLAFCHPPFDFMKDCEEVMKRVEDLAWNFDPATMGFAWNEEACQDYQRQVPELIGYQVLRPVKKL